MCELLDEANRSGNLAIEKLPNSARQTAKHRNPWREPAESSTPRECERKLAFVTPAGHTALLDAIYLGVSKMRDARYQRRALLIISDGGDNHSHYTLERNKEACSGVRRSRPLGGDCRYPDGSGRQNDRGKARSATADKNCRGEWWPQLLLPITPRESHLSLPRSAANCGSSTSLATNQVMLCTMVNGEKSNEVTAATGGAPLRAYYKRGY